jgi:hypothetical protein
MCGKRLALDKAFGLNRQNMQQGLIASALLGKKGYNTILVYQSLIVALEDRTAFDKLVDTP